MTVGILGSGFFVSPMKLVTTYHSVNPNAFTSNATYNNTNILLLSPDGTLLEITESEVEYHSEVDITFIKTNNRFSYLRNKRTAFVNDSITNIGYPENDIQQILSSNPLRIKTSKRLEGNIIEVNSHYSINRLDVNLVDKEVYILNYIAQIGFSGGPLLSGNKVIGMMSHINPSTRTAVAINSKYFYLL